MVRSKTSKRSVKCTIYIHDSSTTHSSTGGSWLRTSLGRGYRSVARTVSRADYLYSGTYSRGPASCQFVIAELLPARIRPTYHWLRHLETARFIYIRGYYIIGRSWVSFCEFSPVFMDGGAATREYKTKMAAFFRERGRFEFSFVLLLVL